LPDLANFYSFSDRFSSLEIVPNLVFFSSPKLNMMSLDQIMIKTWKSSKIYDIYYDAYFPLECLFYTCETSNGTFDIVTSIFFSSNVSLLIGDLQGIFYDRSEVINYTLQEYRIEIRFRESPCKRAIYTVELHRCEYVYWYLICLNQVKVWRLKNIYYL
jgi:hypothetical protein